MRATRQTELEREFPLHVVCSWLGNTEAVAKKSYLLVTDQDFENAREKSGTKYGTVATGTNRQDQEANPEKQRENAIFSGVSTVSQAEDKGFEPSTGFPAPDFESGP